MDPSDITRDGMLSEVIYNVPIGEALKKRVEELFDIQSREVGEALPVSQYGGFQSKTLKQFWTLPKNHSCSAVERQEK